MENEKDRDDEERRLKSNHLISRRKFRAFVQSHPGTESDLEAFLYWSRVVEKSRWTKFSDVRETFGSADRVGNFIVFNVGGNKYRIVTRIQFKRDRPAWIYVRHVLTHKEYDRGDWKKSP